MKIVAPGGGDFAGRLGAWWDGRAYAAPTADADNVAAESGAQAPEESEAAAPADVVTPLNDTPSSKASRLISSVGDVRLRALETLWGEGRFSPGSSDLDMLVLDALFDATDPPGDIGFIGVDGALLAACAARTQRKLRVAEWRAGCVDRLRELAPDAEISPSDVDRPRGFDDHTLQGLVTLDAFAYADHKAGLVARVHRALADSGRWVFIDTVRTTTKAPPQAFASAWAEPQLSTSDDIQELLTLAGFESVRRASITPVLLDAARSGYARLSAALDAAAAAGLPGREGALFLQELAWEAQSWRARIRALEGGALGVELWVADRSGEGAAGRSDDDLAQAISEAMDRRGASELFDAAAEPAGDATP